MNYLEKQVLQEIGEDVSSPDVFTDDDLGMKPIRDSINFALAEICSVTGSYTSEYLLPLYEGRQLYRMNWTKDYFGYVVHCWDGERKVKVRGTTLEILRKERPSWLQDTGDPTMYFQVGRNVLGFDRSPSGGGKVLQIRCVAIPKPYTYPNDPIKVRENFSRAVVFYAASEFFASRGDATRAKEKFDQYANAAGVMRLKPSTPGRIIVMGAGIGDIQR